MTLEEANAIVKKHTDHLIQKWNKTGLLDGLHSDIERSNMSVLIESEEKCISIPEMTEEQKQFSEAMWTIKKAKESQNEQDTKSRQTSEPS